MDNNQRPNDSSDSTSDNNLDHTMDLIKAAFPYLDSDYQQSMDFLIKAGEMMSTLRAMQNRNTVTTFSIRKQSIDLEGLLTSVRNVCYEKEREIVDMILNMIQVKNMYSMYTTLSQTMSSQSDESGNSGNFEGSENSDGSGNSGGMFGNGNMMEILGSLLSPEQKDTFDSLSMLLNTTNN